MENLAWKLPMSSLLRLVKYDMEIETPYLRRPQRKLYISRNLDAMETWYVPYLGQGDLRQKCTLGTGSLHYASHNCRLLTFPSRDLSYNLLCRKSSSIMRHNSLTPPSLSLHSLVSSSHFQPSFPHIQKSCLMSRVYHSFEQSYSFTSATLFFYLPCFYIIYPRFFFF